MPDSRKQVHSQGKRKRVPFGGHRTKLQLSEEDAKAFEEAGFTVRWINDKDGRIERAKAGAWTFVAPEEAISVSGGEAHEEKSDLHGKVSQIVSMGTDSPIRAYLMKISTQYYDEDQEAKEEVNRRTDEALNAIEQGGQSIEHGYTPS